MNTQKTFPCSTGHTPGIHQVYISTDHTSGVLGFKSQKKGKQTQCVCSIHVRWIYV